MADKITRITRKELYDEVWATPMLTLAKKYGLSDVGMAKLCRRNNIPLPGRGYWARKQYMKSPMVVYLPNPGDNPMIEIRDHNGPELSTEFKNTISKSQLEEIIPVPETLRGAHHLIYSALAALEVSQKNDHGLLCAPRSGYLSICVSKNSMRRALRIMDGLLKALEARKFKVFASTDTSGSWVEINGQRVGIRIDEKLETQKVEKEVGNLSGRYEFRYNAFRMEQRPTGRLCIEISTYLYCNTDGLRSRWSDGKRAKLEDLLGAVITGIIVSAGRQADQAAENERERIVKEAEKQRQQEKQRLREELAAKIKEEQSRVDDLFQQVDAWASSQRLREFIAARKALAEQKGLPIGPKSDLVKWITWASQQADRLDPLTESPPSILDRISETVAPNTQYFQWGNQ